MARSCSSFSSKYLLIQSVPYEHSAPQLAVTPSGDVADHYIDRGAVFCIFGRRLVSFPRWLRFLVVLCVSSPVSSHTLSNKQTYSFVSNPDTIFCATFSRIKKE